MTPIRAGLAATLGLLSLALAAAVSAVSAAPQAAASDDPAAYLPKAGTVAGWAPEGEIQRYQGDDLFVYIDGGAEIYHEYGFRRVAALDYRGPADKRVTLEIFEMADAAAAFGVFTFKASGRGKPVAIGQGADLEDYYLSFWKGRWQVTATGSDESPECLAGVQAISRAAADLIPALGPVPDVFASLPAGFADSPHRKYLKGVIGLYNIHPFFRGDVLRFGDAAAAERGGDWVFLFRYGSAAEAAARWPEIRKALEAAGKYAGFALDPAGILTAVDDKGRGTAWKLSGTAVKAALAGGGAAAAAALLKGF